MVENNNTLAPGPKSRLEPQLERIEHMVDAGFSQVQIRQELAEMGIQVSPPALSAFIATRCRKRLEERIEAPPEVEPAAPEPWSEAVISQDANTHRWGDEALKNEFAELSKLVREVADAELVYVRSLNERGLQLAGATQDLTGRVDRMTSSNAKEHATFGRQLARQFRITVIVCLLALAAGLAAGFLAGKLFERSRTEPVQYSVGRISARPAASELGPEICSSILNSGSFYTRNGAQRLSGRERILAGYT